MANTEREIIDATIISALERRNAELSAQVKELEGKLSHWVTLAHKMITELHELADLQREQAIWIKQEIGRKQGRLMAQVTEEAKRLAAAIVEHCVYCDRWQNDPESKCAKHIRAERDQIAAALAARDEKVAKLENAISKLNDRLPCGHRKLDWDDSYGECVVCKIKEQANDYENLPLTIVGCHDVIEARDEEIADPQYRYADERIPRTAIESRNQQISDLLNTESDLRAQLAEHQQRYMTDTTSLTKEIDQLQSDLDSLKDILAAKEICLMDLYVKQRASDAEIAKLREGK